MVVSFAVATQQRHTSVCLCHLVPQNCHRLHRPKTQHKSQETRIALCRQLRGVLCSAAATTQHSPPIDTTQFGFLAFVLCFYPRDAMLARVIAIATCLSVRHTLVLYQNEES